MKCLEPHIRQEELDSQLSSLLDEYALPDRWTKSLNAILDTDEQQAEQSTGVFIADATSRIGNLQSKLQRLLDSYLDQDIDRETYLAKKAELMSEKKSLEERNSKLTMTSAAWVEPMRNWLKRANSICEITENPDLEAKKALAKEIFGSNLILQSQKAQPTAAQNSFSPPENTWHLLRKTKEKAALSGDNLQLSTILAGMEGFEPPNARTKTWCLTTWPHPNKCKHDYNIWRAVISKDDFPFPKRIDQIVCDFRRR